MLGVYTLAKKMFSRSVALVAAFLFVIIPIFVFYDRQALLEAGIMCIGIWSCNALINLIKAPSTKNGAFLGALLGTGFLIKSSSLLFIISAIILITFFTLVKKQTKLFVPSMMMLLTTF